MIFEIENTDWFGPRFRMQIFVENFFPCRQSEILKLFKILDNCNFLDADYHMKLVNLLTMLESIDTKDFTDRLKKTLERNKLLIYAKLKALEG